MEQKKSQDIITIKRYSNRKLYDTSQSRYITLAELGERVRRGENIEVIDNDTKADLTEMTLTQVLMTQQKQKQKGIRNLVQNQAEILLQRISVPMQQIRDEAIRQVEIQVGKLKNHNSKTDHADNAPHEPNTEQPSPSINLKMEALRASSDEKLLSLLLVQRLEQLEAEIIELKRRVEVLEHTDDDRY
jgi:polyhydroxyalkanoate synthesis repressor PhaR